MESYFVDKLDSNIFPLTYRTIDKYQPKTRNMAEKLKRAKHHTKYFCGGVNKFMLICKIDKIEVTKILRKYVVNWYHTYLLYPGTERTEATISQHYHWHNLRDGIYTHINVCSTFHKTGNTTSSMEITP